MRRILSAIWGVCGVALVFIFGMVAWGMLLWWICGAARVWGITG